jgi:hypothetical protein
MRLLLDESVPRKLRFSLASHEVRTVAEVGWAGLKNGELLSLAATAFDAFVTVDKNLPHQQNEAKLPVAVVVLEALSNDLPSLLPLVPALERALAALAPRRFVRVSADA